MEKKDHAVGTVSKSNRKLVATEAKIDTLTPIYTNAHFPCLMHALQ